MAPGFLSPEKRVSWREVRFRVQGVASDPQNSDGLFLELWAPCGSRSYCEYQGGTLILGSTRMFLSYRVYGGVQKIGLLSWDSS